MNKIILVILAIVIIGGAVVLFNSDTAEAPRQSVPQASNTESGNISTSLGIPAPQDDERVVIRGHKIQNGKLTVPVGTTVIFENKDSFEGLPYDAHTITTGTIDPTGQSGVLGVVPNSGSGVPDGLINAPLQKDGEFSFTFGEPGAVTFYVEEHPLVAGEGTVVITAVEEKVVNEDGIDEDESEEDKTSELVRMNVVSFSFAPSTLEAKVGEEINLDITAQGLHTFTIDELGVNVQTPHGKTTRVTFTPDKTGTFTYYCAIPGHREAGQVGTITVSN